MEQKKSRKTIRSFIWLWVTIQPNTIARIDQRKRMYIGRQQVSVSMGMDRVDPLKMMLNCEGNYSVCHIGLVKITIDFI